MPDKKRLLGLIHDPETRQQVVEMARKGMRQEAIAKRFDRCTAWVCKVLKQEGYSLPDARHLKRQAIAADVAAGLSCRDAAKKHRCTLHTVYYARKEAGINVKRLDTQRVLRIVADLMYRQDLRHGEIAQRHSVTLAAVQKIAMESKEAGLQYPARKRGRPPTA